MNNIIQYLKEVRAEMAYVKWPTRNESIFYTVGVLVISAFVAYYLGFLDSMFSKGVDWLLNR
ncbi:MAG: preprotein translocase subunit SecE [bacterium]